MIVSHFVFKIILCKNKGYADYNMVELASSAKACLDSYEKEKNLRMTFTFHDESIKHLARLSRILVPFFDLN